MESDSSSMVAKRVSGSYAEAEPGAQANVFASPWDSRTHDSSKPPEPPLAMSLSGGTRLRKSIVSLTRRVSTYEDHAKSGDDDSSSSSSSSGRSTPYEPEPESPGETGTEAGEETPRTEDTSGNHKEAVEEENPVGGAQVTEDAKEARYTPLETSDGQGADAEHELHSRTLAVAAAGAAGGSAGERARETSTPDAKPTVDRESEEEGEAGNGSTEAPFAPDDEGGAAVDGTPQESQAQEYVEMVREAMFGREGSLILKERKPAVGEKRNSHLEQTADFLSQPRRTSMASAIPRGSASSDQTPRSKRISVVSLVLAPGATVNNASPPAIQQNADVKDGKNSIGSPGTSANDVGKRKNSTSHKSDEKPQGESAHSVEVGKKAALRSGSDASAASGRPAELLPTPPPSKNASSGSVHGPHHKRCIAQSNGSEQSRTSDVSSASQSDAAELDETIPGQAEVHRAPVHEDDEEQANQESATGATAHPVLEAHEEVASVSTGEIAQSTEAQDRAHRGAEQVAVVPSAPTNEVEDANVESTSANEGDYDAVEPLPYLLGSATPATETTDGEFVPTPPPKKRSGSQIRVKVVRLASGQEVYAAVHRPRRPLNSKAFYVAQQGMTKIGWQSVLTAQQNTLQELRSSRAAYKAFVSQLESIKRPHVQTAATAGDD